MLGVQLATAIASGFQSFRCSSRRWVSWWHSKSKTLAQWTFAVWKEKWRNERERENGLLLRRKWGLVWVERREKKEREIKVCICTHLTFTTIDRVKRKSFFLTRGNFRFSFPSHRNGSKMKRLKQMKSPCHKARTVLTWWNDQTVKHLVFFFFSFFFSSEALEKLTAVTKMRINTCDICPRNIDVVFLHFSKYI